MFNQTVENSVVLPTIGNKIPACEYLTYQEEKHTMVEESFVYINEDFLVSYANDNGSSVLNVINDLVYLEGELVSNEEIKCIQYEDDEKFFIEYEGIDFVPWLTYLSFVLLI